MESNVTTQGNFDTLKYDFYVNNRYTITDLIYENIEYEGICNNGFIILHTKKGKFTGLPKMKWSI